MLRLVPLPHRLHTVRLADDEQTEQALGQVRGHHLPVKPLVQGIGPVIGLDQPQHGIQLGQKGTIKFGILPVPVLAFTHAGQIHQPQLLVIAESQVDFLRLPGAGLHRTNVGNLRSKQGIAEAGLTGAGLANNANPWAVPQHLAQTVFQEMSLLG